MGKGNQFKKSIIYRNNLQDTIMELHCRGLCYSEICRVINDKTGLHINRMQISRHLSSVKPDDLKRNTISNLKGIRDRTTENNLKILSDYDLSMNDIISSIEVSHLNNTEKGILKNQILSKLKPVRKSLVLQRGELLDIFQAINECNETTRRFLIDVCVMLCPECRGKIVKVVKSIEQTGDIQL